MRIAKAFGFSSVYGGLVPRGRTPRREIAPLTLVQHVPADWARRYNERDYLFRIPVFRRLYTDPQPFTCRQRRRLLDQPDGRCYICCTSPGDPTWL